MPNDPYFFPFEIANKQQLIPGDKYYIKLNDRIVKDFLDKRRNLPVSHLEGVFVRLHTEVERVNTIEYAVFKKVRILNKIYKEGLCNMMLVRYPEGFLASAGGCSTYSDFSGRTVNEDREVFFNVNRWTFGVPTETKLITKQVLSTVTGPKVPETLNNEISQFQGTMKPLKGGKRRTRRTRRNRRRKQTRRRR